MDEIRKEFDTRAQEPNQCANSPTGYMGGCYINTLLGLQGINLYYIFLVNVKASSSVSKKYYFPVTNKKQMVPILPHY